MLFNSFEFWVVFPLVFIAYWAIPARANKIRNLFLLSVSYLLYMNWNPSFAIVLAGETLVCYISAILVNKQHEEYKNKMLCCIFVIIGLLPLLIFKYYNFINNSISQILELIGFKFALPGLNWAIPVGISFFTFQAVGYLLDVYHRRVAVEKNLLDYALFVSFFPQVVSGPISTAKDLIPQFKSSHSFRYEYGRDGFKMFVWGLFLKLAIADRLGIYVDTVYANYTHYTGAVCLFASIMYTLQIYCDFAGYSFMAIGIAKTLGFNLINNFKRPYLSASITEFWKRWHISLTRWLTTHVYISLGGNRCSKIRQYMNIMITFLVSGLWHGANWTFLIWGFLHSIFQIIEKFFIGDEIKKELKSNKVKFTFVRFIRISITFSLIIFSWIFFRMPSISDSIGFIRRIFLNFGSFKIEPMDEIYIVSLLLCLPILIIKDIRDEYFPYMWNRSILKWFFYVAVFVLIICVGVLDCGQFIYINF